MANNDGGVRQRPRHESFKNYNKIIRSVDSSNINFLIVMACHTHIVSCNWRKLNKRSQALSILFLVTTRESVITLILLKIVIENDMLYTRLNG